MHKKMMRGLASVIAVAAVVAGSVALAGPSGAGPAVASARLVDINGNSVGEAVFRPGPNGSLRVVLTAAIDNTVTTNAAEFHGVHIHAGTPAGCVTYPPDQEPAPAARFTEVGGHWNPTGQAHGAHAGDLPSLMRRTDGTATAEFGIDKILVDQLPGRALIVHYLADDFGKHPGVGNSTTAGNAGPRYACGVIVATANRG